MTNPIRAALERLVSAYYNECEGEYEELWPKFLDEPFAAARAALAQPEPEDDVVLLRAALEATAAQRRAEDDARAALAMPEPEVVGPTRDELWELWLRLDRELPDRPAAVAEFWEHAQVEARARWGRPAPAPAGEVGELVAWSEPEVVFDDEDVITFWTERGGVGGVVVSPALVARARAVTPARSQPAPDAGEVAKLTAEIQHFLDGYRQMQGLDPEYIYSIHRGDAMEAHITVSGLTRTAALLQQLSAQAQAPVPVPVAVSDAAVFDLTTSLGMIAMEAVTSMRARPDWAAAMRSEARQVILEWLNALPLPATTPAGQENHAY